MSLATLICLVCLAALVIYTLWAIRRTETPERELRDEIQDLDLASGKYMRFRRAAEFDPQDRERIGL